MTEETMFTCEGKIYSFVSSTNEWKQCKDESDTSNISVIHNKGSFAAIIATAEENKVVLLKIVFSVKVKCTLKPDNPLFHQLYDGNEMWGIELFDKDISDEFQKRIGNILEEYSPKKDSITETPPLPNLAPKKAPQKIPPFSKNPPPIPKLSSSKMNNDPPQPKTFAKLNSPFLKQSNNVDAPPKKQSGPPKMKPKTPNIRHSGGHQVETRQDDETKLYNSTLKPKPIVTDQKSERPVSLPPGTTTITQSGNTVESSPNSVRISSQPVTTKLDTTSVNPPSSDKSVREMIIDEILKTEIDYVDSLNILRDMYYIPLKYAPRLGVIIFKPGDFEKIFYGFDTILLLNKELLAELKSKKSQGTLYGQCGKVFNVFSHSMKLYIDYVNKYNNTIKLISEYEDSNDTFKKMLLTSMDDVDCQFRGLKDYLIMPIQRIPRYVLLLQQLKSKTAEDHEDFIEISKALTTIESIAGYINNQKKDYEDKEKVTIIQQRLNPKHEPLLKEGRFHIFDGIVYIKNQNFLPPKKPIKIKPNKPDPPAETLGLKEIELFLMNNLILWAEKDLKHNFLNEIKRIDLWEIVDCVQTESYKVPFYQVDDGKYKGFTLKTRDNVDVPNFYVQHPEKHTFWMSKIINEYKDATVKKNEELDRKAKANQ